MLCLYFEQTTYHIQDKTGEIQFRVYIVIAERIAKDSLLFLRYECYRYSMCVKNLDGPK